MDDISKLMIAIAIIGVVALSGAVGLEWYNAGLQRSVWERQGVKMTQWEIFMGAQPIVRNMIETKE